MKTCLSSAVAFQIALYPFQESGVFFTPLKPSEKASDPEPFDPHEAGIKISMIRSSGIEEKVLKIEPYQIATSLNLGK